MFEKEIKFIADVNLNKIKNLGSFITFEKFDNSDVHPAIKQYISAELDFLIHEDRKKLLEQSVFDYSGPEVGKHFNLIAQEVKKNKKISYEDIKKLILQAVSFNVNFIVRPKWSLSKLVYNDAGVKSVDEIKLNLNYVYFYDHIKNILNTYLSKRKLVSFSSTEFEMILDRIDKEIFASDEKKLIDFTLYTMAEFFNIGAANKKLVSPVAVELFLKEKNQIDKVIRLKKSFIDGSKQSVDIEDIRRIIYSNEPMEYDNNVSEIPEEVSDEMEGDKLKFRNIKLKDEQDEEKVQDEIENKIDFVEEINLDEESAEEEIIGSFEIVEEEPGEVHEEEILNSQEPETKEEVEKAIVNPEPAKESELAQEIEDEPESGLDDSFLAFYESELNSFESDITELEEGKESELTGKEELDSLYNFEEDTSDLIKGFSDDIDKKPEIEINNEGHNEIPIDDELNIEESEELTREFLIDEESSEESVEEEDEHEFVPQDTKKEKPSVSKPARKEKEEDIFDYLSNKDIEKIVANVFNDDREDFANTMEKLAECNSYEEATEILKSVFLTYRVNPYSKEAVILTNSVSNYFEQG